jgi:iron complex outermembrane receptor protein
MSHIRTALSTALGLGMILPTCSAFAQTASPSSDSAASASTLDTVVVTGTRQSNRTVGDSQSPIQVISSKELQSSGYTDIGSILNSLLPSVDFPRQNQGAASVQRPFILRGLSPNEVIVLVDGIRYHTSATVNLNTDIARGSAPVDVGSIPIAAIDHIEVLTDGASAQYGSDAIAGVVNIILKHGGGPGTNFVTGQAGQTYKRDGANGDVMGSDGVTFGDDAHPGWVRFSLNASKQQGTNRAQFGNQTPAVIASAGGPAYQYRGDSPESNVQGALNFEYKLSDEVQLFGYLIGGQRRDITYGFYRTQNNSRNIIAIYPNGYLPQQVATAKDLEAVFGAKGYVDGWDWKAYLNGGADNVELQAANTLNVAFYKSFGYSPVLFYLGQYQSSDSQASLQGSKDFSLPFLKYPLTVSLGVEGRDERYRIKSGSEPSYYGDTIGSPVGAQIRTGTPPGQAGTWFRYSGNAYVDLETKLTDQLSAGVAGRVEHYDEGIGSTESGKLSLRYQFDPAIALRATASNGFRAPSLAQEHYQSINTSIVAQQLQQSGTYAVDSAAARALGAEPLKPEKSANYSVGLVLKPTRDLDVTLDAYQIRIRNEIAYSDRITLAAGSALANYFNSVVPNQQVTGAQFFLNGATTRTRGVDLVINDRLDLGGAGKVTLSLGGNINRTTVLDTIGTNAILQTYAPTQTLFGQGARGLLTDAAPKTKVSLTADWTLGPWDFIANETHYGSVTRYPAENPYPAGIVPQKYSGKWITDLSVNYRIDHWTLTAGADNVFNVYPDKINSHNDLYLANEIPYDSGLSPWGINGGFYYVKASYRF